MRPVCDGSADRLRSRVSRPVDVLIGDGDAAIGRVSGLDHDLNGDWPKFLDVAATLVTPIRGSNFPVPRSRRLRFYLLLVLADHGAAGTGELLAGMLETSNARAEHGPGHNPGRRRGPRADARTPRGTAPRPQDSLGPRRRGTGTSRSSPSDPLNQRRHGNLG